MEDLQSLADRFSLKGEHALITGGGTGLGYAIAASMCAAGAVVTIVGRREAPLREACEQLGANAGFISADITQTETIPALVAEATKARGPISILVNNAGIHLKKPALETSDQEFQSVLQTHVNAAFAMTRECARGMVERQKGSVLFMASMTSFIGMPSVVSYSAAKSAYLGLVRTLSNEWAASGLRVNGIAPGWIGSDMLEQALAKDPARRDRILQRIPTHTFGQPEDIGSAAVYLSSPAARYVNGVVLPVDGGALPAF